MDPIAAYQLSWMAFWLVLAFVSGCAVGSFLNVCVARLPYEKSLLWPGSHCGTCLQPIAAADNVPLFGYLRLRGRCRTCNQPFSMGYFFVELFTGAAFAGLLYLLMFANVRAFPHSVPAFQGVSPGFLAPAVIFLHHATLLSFLLVVSLCDLRDMEIPLPITATGTAVGLAFATLCPWPYPETLPRATPAKVVPFGAAPEAVPPVPGVYPWPAWYPLPEWLPAGGWRLGLATGLAGALAGMVLLRGVRFLFGLGRGIEGMGVGDADLMMMAGAFVGWQPVVLAFFVSVFPALLFAVVQVARRGDQALPFGPALALGVLLTLLGWRGLGPQFQVVFFDPVFLAVLGVAGGLFLLATAFLLRLVRGTDGAGAESP